MIRTREIDSSKRVLFFLVCLTIITNCTEDNSVKSTLVNDDYTDIVKIEISPKKIIRPRNEGQPFNDFSVYAINSTGDTLDLENYNLFAFNRHVVLAFGKETFYNNYGAGYIFAKYEELVSDTALVVVNDFNSDLRSISVHVPQTKFNINDSFNAQLIGTTYENKTILIDPTYLKVSPPELITIESDGNIKCIKTGKSILYTEYKGIVSDSVLIKINDPSIIPQVNAGSVSESNQIHQVFDPPVRFGFGTNADIDLDGEAYDFYFYREFSVTLSASMSISISPNNEKGFEMIHNLEYKISADSILEIEKDKPGFYGNIHSYWCEDLDSGFLIDASCNWTKLSGGIYRRYYYSSDVPSSYSSPSYLFMKTDEFRYVGIRKKIEEGVYAYGWLKVILERATKKMYLYESTLQAIY